MGSSGIGFELDSTAGSTFCCLLATLPSCSHAGRDWNKGLRHHVIHHLQACSEEQSSCNLSSRGVAGRERVARLGVADLCRGLAGLCRSRVSRRVMRWTTRGDPFGVPPGLVFGVVRGVLGVAREGSELGFRHAFGVAEPCACLACGVWKEPGVRARLETSRGIEACEGPRARIPFQAAKRDRRKVVGVSKLGVELRLRPSPVPKPVSFRESVSRKGAGDTLSTRPLTLPCFLTVLAAGLVSPVLPTHHCHNNPEWTQAGCAG